MSFPTPVDTVSTSLLLATVPSVQTPHFLSAVIQTATSLTKDKLVIVLFSRCFNLVRDGSTYPESLAISHTATSSWKDVQRLLTFVYVQATKIAQEKGRVLMDIDNDLDELVKDLNVEVVFRVSGDSIATPLPASIGAKRTAYLHAGGNIPDLAIAEGSYSSVLTPLAPQTPFTPQTPSLSRSTTSSNIRHDVTDASFASISSLLTQTQTQKPKMYPVVALGGTFDHLHAGHKILLSMGAWIASEKLIVGVTSSSILSKKPNAELVEPLEVRMENVRKFLGRFKKGIEYYLTELTDVYGPTGYDPNVQALVVSRETISGAKEIAAHRASHNLPPLDLYVIDVISSTNHNLDHEDVGWLKDMKLSSTFIRSWIAERDAKAKEVQGVDSKN
ncbi:hypothetical protein DFP72DRAFT_873522 [Ephemerocybe angulata]|uniref:Cytidyltransferase-like domain-containing protein n=1 Tax=Ephemerocybe angulata TaxID=980116 RepID=A0A8H6IGP0_9AGAR|nr:hypothetical protein DFP72DRAFT_873522 [Tulosesus angulatus]